MRLNRALHEYFVAGIKTNISLFQRILRDSDFQAGKLDTSYLDRLLAKPDRAFGLKPHAEEIKSLEEIAAIAAGMFAVLDPAGSVTNGVELNRANARGAQLSPSQWKRQARSEGLR